jgi:hypothetical protein
LLACSVTLIVVLVVVVLVLVAIVASVVVAILAVLTLALVRAAGGVIALSVLTGAEEYKLAIAHQRCLQYRRTLHRNSYLGHCHKLGCGRSRPGSGRLGSNHRCRCRGHSHRRHNGHRPVEGAPCWSQLQKITVANQELFKWMVWLR